ncbi:MAG: M23 family peptidase [Actinobacteria bacterium ATB1]|nr:M23 family peptidase [Actinobacteria bacterium ATB1]
MTDTPNSLDAEGARDAGTSEAATGTVGAHDSRGLHAHHAVGGGPSRGRHDASPDPRTGTGYRMSPRVALATSAGLLTVLAVLVVAVLFPLRTSESAGQTTPQSQNGALTWACPAESPYRYEDTFGASRPGGRAHKGTDLFASKGSPATAIVGGTVTKAVPTDDGTLGGARVWVAGDDGWWYYYAHLDSVTVEVGQRVETGLQIGTVGNTGNAKSTPSHIHIEMHFQSMTGPYVNPHAVISAVCTEPG